jgi:hypothetical protein
MCALELSGIVLAVVSCDSESPVFYSALLFQFEFWRFLNFQFLV